MWLVQTSEKVRVELHFSQNFHNHVINICASSIYLPLSLSFSLSLCVLLPVSFIFFSLCPLSPAFDPFHLSPSTVCPSLSSSHSVCRSLFLSVSPSHCISLLSCTCTLFISLPRSLCPSKFSHALSALTSLSLFCCLLPRCQVF